MTRWQTVEVVAPSRLHFGLLSFGHTSGRLFGGVGAMLDLVAAHIRLTAASSFSATGIHAERVREFAARWMTSRSRVGFDATAINEDLATNATDLERLPCTIEVCHSARQHVGLGTGTQLGLSVAAGLNAMFESPAASVGELAASVGRGERSGVGAYGFVLGGLIFECGRSAPDRFPELDRRVAIPTDWRFLLICPRQAEGLSGASELAAFSQLPPVTAATSDQLYREASEVMIPALEGRDFDTFSESIYRYGWRAGLCFEPVQGSAFNGPWVEAMVHRLRSWGVAGVGQTSWGPTVFAILPSQSAALDLRDRLARESDSEGWEICCAAASAEGARVLGSRDGQATRLSPVVARPGESS